jgi:hypothetical protein
MDIRYARKDVLRGVDLASRPTNGCSKRRSSRRVRWRCKRKVFEVKIYYGVVWCSDGGEIGVDWVGVVRATGMMMRSVQCKCLMTYRRAKGVLDLRNGCGTVL